MEAVKLPEPMSFEEVWAIVQKTSRGLEEMRENQEKSRLEFDRKMEESRLENERQKKEYNKWFGDLSNRFGEIVEYMVAPKLCEKINEYGYNFVTASGRYRVNDYANDINLEMDIKLDNSETVMFVEVKSKLTAYDVKSHIERLFKMRNYADLHNDKRIILGGVAGVVIPTALKTYSLKQGLFVVEPSGETFNITPPKDKPKEW